jgi:2-oxoisovalerate dehydrogenase E1 component alpha subunit
MDAHDEQVRLLDAEGNLDTHPSYKVDLDDEQFRTLYRQMVVARRVDQEGMHLQRQGQLGIWAPLVGQEAAQVGSANALAEEDYVFPSYREHAVAYVRGLDLVEMFRLYRGQRLSGWDPSRYRFAPYSIPIATHALHAVGWAIGAKWDGGDQIAVTYFGDGATSEGDLSEALNFAAVNAAPVVFFCQNNQWAISVPLAKQAVGPLFRRGPGFGVPGVQVDGNDVVAVYAVTKAAVERAREGGGPTFIEAVTYRLGAHTTTDDPTRYRTRDELDLWASKEPIGRYKAFLVKSGIWTDELEAETQAEADRVVARVREAVEEMPDPPLSDLHAHVYADPPLTLRRQVEALEAFESELEEAGA